MSFKSKHTCCMEQCTTLGTNLFLWRHRHTYPSMHKFCIHKFKFLQVKTELKENGVVIGTLQVKVAVVEPPNLPRYVYLSTRDMTMRYATNTDTLLHGNDSRTCESRNSVKTTKLLLLASFSTLQLNG